MAHHARTQIRRRLIDFSLDSLKSFTGSGQIHSGSPTPMSAYPTIALIGGGERRIEVENPGYINGGEKRYRRRYQFRVEVAVLEETDGEAEVDELARLVEEALAADDNLGGGVIATDMLEITIERRSGEDEIHVASMLFEAEFRTLASDPTTFLM